MNSRSIKFFNFGGPMPFSAFIHRCRLVFLFIFLALLAGCESKKTIVNGLEEKDANEILVFLASKNIDAAKIAVVAGAGGGQKAQLFDIMVPSSQLTEAMAILNANGLPRRRGQNLLNLFNSSSLVPSEMQDKIRYQAGLAEQISNTIRKIDGVIEADVQLSFPQEDPLNPQAPKGKVVASVYVKHQGVLDDPNSHLVTKIKRLVSSSVNGLDYDDVTVIGDKARFSEAATEAQQAKEPKEKLEYVKVWSIVVAKDSLNRFQAFFFAFSLTILLLLLVLVWLVWKLYPVAKQQGGFHNFFSIKSLAPEEKTKEEKKEGGEVKKEGEEKTPEKDKNEPPKVQENIENQ